MLLIIEALLLILSALGQDHRDAVERQIYPLDMAPNSVDDQYFGCRENMKKQVERNYLKKELSNSADFKMAWQESEKNVGHNWVIWDPFKKQHKIAIYIYTQPNFNIFSQFNSDTRHGKQNYTGMKFKWYSLYFLLTDAIQILKKTQNRCFRTFRGTNVQLNGHVSTDIRFGSFTSSSFDRDIAKRFGTKSCFEIRTCEGAELTKYSKHPEEKEVLIPPYETFNVIAVKTRRDQTNLWCDTVYELESSGTRSALNCALFNNEPTPQGSTMV
ncbi:ecto-ADP-ribosyltransferase 5-like [Ctenopharyngodon idella]|uniref:ecto-ADP-ribosyltransferase 5-like n=1 Tax=Ctenopharyngodon idella TaxID=7959 RepID=UPI00222EC269|nr:ecto-ADP-ribosyltransferase 5-like [Ctenopharyngodon idella]XP_051719212.1 ecto-ADP-ribosyltransferase 5-like [Ctenopharyngodon idella]XP_051719213.1 ecto-ADP-ribosyltransferase 5-like [Ctenopharyngodon idella]